MPDPIDVKMGAVVRNRRAQLGITQAQLGEHCGITFQQIQKYEKGSNRISVSMLFKIATRLQTSPQVLIMQVTLAQAQGEPE